MTFSRIEMSEKVAIILGVVFMQKDTGAKIVKKVGSFKCALFKLCYKKCSTVDREITGTGVCILEELPKFKCPAKFNGRLW